MKKIGKKIYYTILMIVSRREMKKQKLSKDIIDGWTVNTICKIWNLKDPEQYYNEQIANNIKIIEKKVDDLIEDKIVDDQVNKLVQDDWLIAQSDKDPDELI